MLLLMLRKGVKSLQLTLNEFLDGLDRASVTASAYSQARQRLKYTAFIELNREAVAKVCYQDGDSLRYQGFRLLAIDGSKVRLPDTKDITAEFGQIRYRNKNPEVDGVHPWGLASVLYDVLNDVALDARLGAAKAYEVDLAVAPLAQTRPGDLIVTDRHYPSYRFLAAMAQAGRDFVSRCSATSFRTARAMRRGAGPDSQIVTLKADAHQRHRLRELGLPLTLKVRFVRVTLGTGE